jgi:antibiotic biosynthesis monooxygenase (ABM) superfamily enzyme
MDTIQFIDAFRNGAQDAGYIAVSAFGAAVSGLHIWFAHLGVPATMQTWFATALLLFSVVLMTNQFRYLIRGGFILVASLTALELIKPVLLAVAAGVLFISH